MIRTLDELQSGSRKRLPNDSGREFYAGKAGRMGITKTLVPR